MWILDVLSILRFKGCFPPRESEKERERVNQIEREVVRNREAERECEREREGDMF